MPSSALEFRSVCGCFIPVYINFMTKRAKRKKEMRCAIVKLRSRLDGVLCGLLLTFLYWGSLLQQAGDVELNPGPLDKLRQTRLEPSGSRSSSKERPDASGVEPTKGPEPTLRDVMKMLQLMDLKFDGLKEDVKVLGSKLTELEDDVHTLRDEIVLLREEKETLEIRNENLEKRMEAMERKTDDLECRSKRSNIIVHGLKREDGETGSDCEAKLKQLLVEKMELGEEVSFDRVHRLSSKADSPIIACCTSFKDKVKIMKEKRKLKGTDVFIGEDFSTRVREIRKSLVPHMKKARSDGKNVRMVFDHLILEGKKVTVDRSDNLVELK